MKSHLWQPTIFKFFGGSLPLDPQRWIAPLGESVLTLIYAPCYAIFDACENVS